MSDKIENNLKNILDSLPSEKIDGKEILIEMKNNNQQYKQLEYQAFYFEDYINSKLDVDFEKHKFKNGTCVIDTFYEYPIDIKAHDINENLCPLNDGATIEKAINDYGKFGLIVLNLEYEKDDGTLRAFQKELGGNKSSFKNTSGKHRAIKKNFLVKNIEYYEITDVSQLKKFNQGKNSNGKPRPYKYNLDTSEVKSTIHIDKEAV